VGEEGGGFLLFCKKGFVKGTFFTNSLFSEGRKICPRDDFFNQGKEFIATIAYKKKIIATIAYKVS
jgi:hypothetical protein